MECYLCPLQHSIKFNTPSLSICYVQGTVLNDSGAEIRRASSGLLHYTAPGPPTARSYTQLSGPGLVLSLTIRCLNSYKWETELPAESTNYQKRAKGWGGGREKGRGEEREGEWGREARGNGEKESLWANHIGKVQEQKSYVVWDEPWRMGRILDLAMMVAAAMAAASRR